MEAGRVLVGIDEACFILRLEGDVRVPWCVSLESYCETVIKQGSIESVCVDLTPAENLDSTTLGVLAKLAILCQKECGSKASLLCSDGDLLRLVKSMAFDQVFDIDERAGAKVCSFENLPHIDCSELEAQESVIDAHRTLMDLSEENRQAFMALITALEETKKQNA